MIKHVSEDKWTYIYNRVKTLLHTCVLEIMRIDEDMDAKILPGNISHDNTKIEKHK